MKFNVTNGKGLISIGLGGRGSYFGFKSPLSIVWDDCHGTVAKYFCLLPFSVEYRSALAKKLAENISRNFTNSIEDLFSLIEPVVSLFPNGEYSLDYFHSDSTVFFDYSLMFIGKGVYDWKLIFPNTVTNIEETELRQIKHKLFLADVQELPHYYHSTDLLSCTTYNFYDGDIKSFIATQPFAKINKERVEFFENAIKSGERPCIIVFKASREQKEDELEEYALESENFVLDGHHKLLAYKNLGIRPSIAQITYHAKEKSEVYFDIERLIELLYPWQVEHMLKTWHTKEIYFADELKNPKSKIHHFIKNGLFREYYENGQLKCEASYVNDKIDGPARGWFQDGKLEYENFYKKCIPIGLWRKWFQSGKPEYFQPYNDEGEYNGTAFFYYENGEMKKRISEKNGVRLDGYSSQSWYENGEKEEETKFCNGSFVHLKKYDRSGKLEFIQKYDRYGNLVRQKKMWWKFWDRD